MIPHTMVLNEWGRYMCDADVFAPAVRFAFDEADLPLSGIKAGYPGSNAVFLCGDYVVKFAGPMFHDDLFREAAALKALGGGVFPRVLCEGVYDDGHAWPYFIMNRLPGVAIRESETPVHAVLSDMADTLKRVWNAPTPEGVPKLDVLAADYLYNNQRMLLELGFAPAFVEALGRLAPHPGAAPVLVHGDVTEDHPFVEGGRVVGLIDFADALIAPRAYEYVALFFGLLDADRTLLDAFATLCGDAVDDRFIENQMALTARHVSGAYIIKDVCERRGVAYEDLTVELMNGFWA